MEYEVVVPNRIRDEIHVAIKSVETEDKLYELLETGLAYGHEKTCFRLAAPSPTYVYKIDINHDGADLVFTFWLTYGAKDYVLYVMQWDVEEQDFSEWDPDYS